MTEVERPLAVRIFNLANTMVRPLLKSPLHGLLSSRLTLLVFRGRKSGREFELPVGYFPWDPGEVLLTSSRRWWVNLSDGDPVRIRVRGRWHRAVPTVVTDLEAKADLLGEFAERKGAKAAKGLMLGLPGDRLPGREELLAAAAKTTLIRLKLGEESSNGS